MPFIVALIRKKAYGKFDIQTISQDFEDEYGLIIPYLPMLGILQRVRRRGFLRFIEKEHFESIQKESDYDEFEIQEQDQLREFNKVLKDFIDYSLSAHGQVLSKVQAEEIFVSFLKDHDLAILFATQGENTLLPETQISHAEKYLIFSFVKSSYDNEPEIFNFISKIAIGHFLASTILYEDLDRFMGRMSGINSIWTPGFCLVY